MPLQRSSALLALAGILASTGACSHPQDIAVNYAVRQADSGTVDVVLNGASDALSVAVNGALVVDRKFSRKAHVEGVPAGPARVTVATGGGCEDRSMTEHDIEIVAGSTTTLTLPGPTPNTGCMIYAGLSSIAVQISMVGLAIMVGALAGAQRVARSK
ncbi:MAG: hypothetical protein H0T79_07075 [Deltaproteobacteria bacterium]|nr:hypothetical protein [Deltaproteobacteria bacterium]